MKAYRLVSIFCIFFVLNCKNIEKKQPITSTTETEEAIPNKSTESKINNLKIKPLVHASAILEYGEKTIYIDPTGGQKMYSNQKEPDLVLITDIHGDHMNIDTLDSLSLFKATIVVPSAVAEKLPANYTDQILIINNNETKEIKGISIEAVPMYNLREEALKFHNKGRGNGYVITLGNERIYFSGDTEDIPEMRALKNIDKAFVCMNLPWTMTVENAADAVLEFKPKQVYPYHYRGQKEFSDVSKFKELVNKGDTSIEVVQLDWYPETN